jgi:hypothetical protein
MPVYTVHQPPPRDADTLTHFERFRFVRDGFSFRAAIFGPLWLIWHRLWLALIGYVLALVLLAALLGLSGVSGGAGALIVGLFALLFGFEANTLRRWTFSRRGWTNVGVVASEDLPSAERRFFDNWLRHRNGAPVPTQPAVPSRQPLGAPDVIGLFPEPGARP